MFELPCTENYYGNKINLSIKKTETRIYDVWQQQKNLTHGFITII